MLIFATKRNVNGSRSYLFIDTKKHTYATNPQRMFYSREDFVEVGRLDLRRLKERIIAEGFRPVDFIG